MPFSSTNNPLLSALYRADFLLSCNHRRTQKLGGKAATPDGISVPSYSFFGGIPMYDIDRLINAGLDAETAFDTVFWYKRQGNDSGLERYICEIERGQRQRPNDG